MPIERHSGIIAHAITVDVEDWYHVCGYVPAQERIRHQERVEQAVGLVLELLQTCGVRGTFFMLGSVAQQHPDLAPRIAADGHELASHGWSHRLVTGLSAEEFRAELVRTADLLEQQTGRRPFGFRAPRWSLSRETTPWAFDILAEQGYRYDSSLTPLAAIGNPRGPRNPHWIATSSCSGIWELPPLVTSTPFGNLPTGGGWGFRFFPNWFIRHTVQAYQHQGLPGVLFVHPREVDPHGPRLDLGLFRGFVAYGCRTSAAHRLTALLRGFAFKPLGEVVEAWQTVS